MIRALLVAGSLCLAGCVTSYPPPLQYDLGEFHAPPMRSGALAANIIVPDGTQPTWMRTRDIFYRMDYQSPPRPQRYVLSQWVATPGEMVSLRLRQAVQSANTGFTLAATNGAAGYLLQTDIEEFTQVFATPTDSHCVLQLRASLWRANGPIIAQKEFARQLPAPSPDAAGAVRCLAAAVDQESGDIVRWLSAAVSGSSG